MAGPAPAAPVLPFSKDSLKLDEARSGASRMFYAGNGCDAHMDEETPMGDHRISQVARKR